MELALDPLQIVLILLQLPLAFLVLYLDVLSAAAVLWRPALSFAPPGRHFAILVPAHNEEVLLPRLLQSLSDLAYPRRLFDICVVADNCSDRTSEVARAGGARVYERLDDDDRGKGYALRWLLRQLKRDKLRYDAYVVIDADSVTSSNFLDVMNRHMELGHEVLQSDYGVLNSEESWSSGLRYVGLALYNNLRPRGRDAFGLSAGLHGNGMCFSSDVIARFRWEAFALAEDVEFHFNLVDAGIKTHYAGEATVLAEMPTTLRQAHDQNIRWERGRLQMLRTFGPSCSAAALRRRDVVRFDAVVEQLVPPLSILVGLATLAVLVCTLLGAEWALCLAIFLIIGEVAYVGAGLRLVHASPRVCFALARAPLYIAWKLWIYALAVIHLDDMRWIRTARSADDI
jgi:1,2-diacylglycerol 3-beta-glucosyltransferase